ncbi:hypothetical protein Vadar_012884 [Vaccinium darrowii]|uniref:Uncharacterized protein n=1 Tax=Vaccinium darrowii TaxID=229202 RepID=A0ACB7X0T5_9ERIC|nr:hypothetical protein Vadar_012884 [Vaccinium darrowii]
MNCDVAVSKNGKEATLAVIVRDCKGTLLNGTVNSAYISSPLQGELLAIRRACVMGKDLGLHGFTIESDNQMAIKLSVSELDPPWEDSAIVWDIRQLGLEMKIQFCWIKRTANELAHAVASKAIRGLLPSQWVAYPPSFVIATLAKDSSSSLL